MEISTEIINDNIFLKVKGAVVAHGMGKTEVQLYKEFTQEEFDIFVKQLYRVSIEAYHGGKND